MILMRNFQQTKANVYYNYNENLKKTNHHIYRYVFPILIFLTDVFLPFKTIFSIFIVN